MIEMRLTNGTIFKLDNNGVVLYRSNGPQNWNYSGKWIITGASKRHHSRQIIPLEDILAGADFSQGWVHDLDHGAPIVGGVHHV